jgi:hypothetical protein
MIDTKDRKDNVPSLPESSFVVGKLESAICGDSTENITIGFNILDPKAIREETLSFITEAVSGNNYKSMIDYLRSLPVEKQNVFKRKLPWFNLGSFEGSRSNANWKYGIGVVLDYDHLRYPPSYYKKYVLPKLTFCQIAFASPRGKGLKVIILWDRIVTDEAEQRELFLWVKDMYDRALNEASDNTPDPARATFFSWDEHIYVNPFAKRLPVDKALHIIRYRERKAMAKKLRKYLLREKKNSREYITANEETLCPPSTHPTEQAQRGPQREGRQSSSYNVQSPPSSEGRQNSYEGRQSSCEGGRDVQISAPLCPPPYEPHRKASGVISEEEDYERAEAVVNRLARMVINHDDWVKCGLALYAGFGERGKELWDMFLHNPHYQDSQSFLDSKWRSFRANRTITLGTLFYIGEKYGVR